MSQINCLASSHGSSANLHGDMSERNTRANVPFLGLRQSFLTCFSPALALSVSIHLEYARTMGGICWKTHTLVGFVRVCPRSTVTYSVHNNSYPSDSPLSRIPFDLILANEIVEGERQVNNQSL